MDMKNTDSHPIDQYRNHVRSIGQGTVDAIVADHNGFDSIESLVDYLNAHGRDVAEARWATMSATELQDDHKATEKAGSYGKCSKCGRPVARHTVGIYMRSQRNVLRHV